MVEHLVPKSFSNVNQKEWIRECDEDIVYIPFPIPGM